jgi:hypothetical protein
VSGFWPSSHILKEHSVSQTRSVSVLRWKSDEAPFFCVYERTFLNHWRTHIQFSGSYVLLEYCVVNRRGVWIGNWVYWTLIDRNNTRLWGCH